MIASSLVDGTIDIATSVEILYCVRLHQEYTPILMIASSLVDGTIDIATSVEILYCVRLRQEYTPIRIWPLRTVLR